MLQSPFDKTQFLQDILDVFNVITIYINIPIPANKCMQYSKFGATQCVFAEQYPYEISNVPLKDTPCPLEEYSVHLKQDFPWKGPQGEWGPGRAARARQKSLNLETLLARARGAPRTPFTPRTSFKGKCVNFHMSNLPFKGAVSLLEKPILLHNM